MATSREIRRMAFQALYQLDARAGAVGADIDAVRASLGESESITPAERDTALKIALAAYENRAAADAAMAALAPTWPAHRQAAVDRALLRLAHYEMTRGADRTKPKVVVNDTVEFAKEFSTDKSPAFINGLLDKVLKQLPQAPAVPATTPPPASSL